MKISGPEWVRFCARSARCSECVTRPEVRGVCSRSQRHRYIKECLGLPRLLCSESCNVGMQSMCYADLCFGVLPVLSVAEGKTQTPCQGSMPSKKKLSSAASIRKSWRRRRKELSIMEGLETCIQQKGACGGSRARCHCLGISDMFPDRFLQCACIASDTPGTRLQPADDLEKDCC